MFKITVFSPLEGVLLKDGVPQKGVTVERVADHYNDKVYKDQVVTDDQGRFSLPMISTRSLRPLMFETRVHQKLTAQVEGQSYVLWETVKPNEKPFSEVGNFAKDQLPTAISARCDVAKPIEMTSQGIRGCCQIETK